MPIWFDEQGNQSNKIAKAERRLVAHSVTGCRVCALVAYGRLDFCWWLLAWDRYALAAAATGQMPFNLAMRHKANMVTIATNALTEGKTTAVAVIYDELVR